MMKSPCVQKRVAFAFQPPDSHVHTLKFKAAFQVPVDSKQLGSAGGRGRGKRPLEYSGVN